MHTQVMTAVCCYVLSVHVPAMREVITLIPYKSYTHTYACSLTFMGTYPIQVAMHRNSTLYCSAPQQMWPLQSTQNFQAFSLLSSCYSSAAERIMVCLELLNTATSTQRSHFRVATPCWQTSHGGEQEHIIDPADLEVGDVHLSYSGKVASRS